MVPAVALGEHLSLEMWLGCKIHDGDVGPSSARVTASARVTRPLGDVELPTKMVNARLSPAAVRAEPVPTIAQEGLRVAAGVAGPMMKAVTANMA